ncbi:hypothetical protein [Oceanobacillus sp. CFH 90083]|uniref:hypothetical protein n=1 Tax=Oceanobacillus sp. CFH 90083 TaxID=2592336 RepID=UPI00128CC42C|nr:hypothetical protein [Oceanobacillus sp. CFH 90083]
MESKVFSRFNSKVLLVGPESIIKNVESLANPYLKVNELSDSTENLWTIFTSERYLTSLQDYEIINYEYPGEPDRCYLFNGKKREIIIKEPNENRWKAQQALRLIRGVLRLQDYAENAIFLHGGLVEINGNGVALIGQSKSGKTSTILTLLEDNQVNYVTNDDISIKFSNDTISGFGWPRSMSIRKDTINVNKKIRSRFKNNYTLNHPFNNATQDYIFATPKNLEQLYNKKIKTNTNIKTIVFPKFLPLQQNGVFMRKLDEKEATYNLINSVVINPGKLNEFFLPHFVLPKIEELIPNIMNIAKRVECYELKQNFYSLEEGATFIKKIAK